MKCGMCDREATGTFWVAVHEKSRENIKLHDVFFAEPSCESCGQDHIDRWTDYGAPRPKGFIPGVVTNDISKVERVINQFT